VCIYTHTHIMHTHHNQVDESARTVTSAAQGLVDFLVGIGSADPPRQQPNLQHPRSPTRQSLATQQSQQISNSRQSTRHHVPVPPRSRGAGPNNNNPDHNYLTQGSNPDDTHHAGNGRIGHQNNYGQTASIQPKDPGPLRPGELIRPPAHLLYNESDHFSSRGPGDLYQSVQPPVCVYLFVYVCVWPICICVCACICLRKADCV
jgi:hypothetical protein